MVSAAPTAVLSAANAAEMVEALQEGRERTLALVQSVSDADLARVHSDPMSPLVWDLAHIAAFEDLWLTHRWGERGLLRPDLAAVYDAFESPRVVRNELPLLGPAAARRYLADVRRRTLEVIDERGIGDGTLHEMVLRHEHQHNETMLQTLQLACLADYEPAGVQTAPEPPGPSLTGLELVEIPAGECTIGAPADGFAYDNERPRHSAVVPAYQIGLTPVTNAAYAAFVHDGGYQRREWWSEQGWAWKQRHRFTRPGSWTEDHSGEWRLGKLAALDPRRPVIHVSWFEADAFARAHGARLPTEVEWEKAASWDEQEGAARALPWGADPLIAGFHANVDQLGGGPAPAGAYPRGASPYGCLGMIGDVWEWTASRFDGYDGFVARPYKEYSEVFFGTDYEVLRGGSWATRARSITSTFRNWDYPQRRQIFAGIRIARDS